MKSMTGYGKAVYKENGFELSVEIKTVNNRFLDINCKYPKGFAELEEIIRNCVKKRLSRGRADIYINFTDNRENNRVVEVDNALALAVVNAAESASTLTGLELSGFSLSDLMRYPEVIKTGDEGDRSFLAPALESALSEAIDALTKMRSEGEKLKADILSRLSSIEQALSEIELRAPEVSKNYKIKLEQRIQEFLKDVEIDQTRLLNEVAVYSDRSNIDEEITRLKSHINQFKIICGEQNSGKKLDFLVQELNREANTICSKSNNVEVTNHALLLKCEIEKIKEQVQNIE